MASFRALGSWRSVALFVGVLFVCATQGHERESGAGAGASTTARRIEAIAKDLDTIQFKTSEVLYQQIRESVVSRFFPVDMFPVGIARASKQAEQEASKLSLRCFNMRSDWIKQKDSTDLFKGLRDGCSMYARLEVDELQESIAGVLQQRDTFLAAKQQLEHGLIKGYKPTNWFEMAVEEAGFYLELVVYMLCFLTPLVFLCPCRNRANWPMRIGFLLVVLGVAVLPMHVTVKQVRARWGPPETVVGVRDNLQALRGYWHAFDHAALNLNDSIGWLSEYCQAMDLFNETVIQGIVQFSQKVTALSSQHGASEDPIAALEIVTQSKDRIAEQKLALTKLAASKSIRNKHTDLDQLLRFLQYFEVFFTQMEASIYVNLKTGYEMNQFFVENMDVMIQHIKDGNLVSCLTILTELHRQQLSQLAKLREANTFVRHTNDAIAQIRQESTRLQPSLESEEMEVWIKKMASKGSMALAAMPTISALGVPLLAVLPATAVGGAIALTGYYWSGFYEKAEKDTRAVISELSKLDDVLIKVENSLSSHENALSLLMEEVGGVLRNINHTEARFSYIQVRRSFSQREVDVLTTGVTRLKDSVKALSGRYQESMNSLFSRILSQSTMRSLPSSPSVSRQSVSIEERPEREPTEEHSDRESTPSATLDAIDDARVE